MAGCSTSLLGEGFRCWTPTSQLIHSADNASRAPQRVHRAPIDLIQNPNAPDAESTRSQILTSVALTERHARHSVRASISLYGPCMKD